MLGSFVGVGDGLMGELEVVGYRVGDHSGFVVGGGGAVQEGGLFGTGEGGRALSVTSPAPSGWCFWFEGGDGSLVGVVGHGVGVLAWCRRVRVVTS